LRVFETRKVLKLDRPHGLHTVTKKFIAESFEIQNTFPIIAEAKGSFCCN